MANYYLNNDGTLSKENKKKKGKNYILQEDGSLRLSQEDIAPVKTSASKRTWFNSGLFEDGLDFEDIPKTLLGTNVDFAEDLSSGLAGIGEGIIDTVATGVGAIAKKLGKDDFADKTQKFIERDLVNENKWDEKLASKIPGVELLQKTNIVANKGDTEKVSVLGEKTDAVVQSAGQLGGTYGLQAVGVPWWLTTGATSFGGGAEEAFQNDATYGEAGTYGLINAGAEIISEKLTGGIKFGGVALDEGLKKTLTKGISNKVAKTLVSLGWDAAGEGFEEVFSEVMTNIGKKLTYEKESTLDELLLSEDAMDAYLESFIGGAVLGGGANVGKVAHSAKTGRDYDTGLTVNEQSVVDAEVKNRITERQKNVAVKEKIDQLITEQEKTFGTLSDSEKKRIKEQVQSQLEEIDYTTTKISKKEQTEIEKQVREDLEKGYIGIEQIESTLASGKTAEIKDLESQLTNTSDKVKKSEIQAKIKQLKADRATQLTGALGKDTYLQESYRQEALKRKEFSREVKEEDTDITKELLESAKNSKMNDTRRMHDLFEYTNKIANDTGTKYGFVNNEQLKQLGHDVEGRTINGLVRVNEDGTTKILINVDSDKSLNTIIGHETTHLFEGTSEYKALQDIAKEYAITKGEYDSRLKQIQSLYEGTNANIENEITADLVGDYLFTDEQFINSLSTKQPNVFQKIYDYIKHAYKMATAGSKEARQLEQLKRRFDKAYKEMSKATTGKVDSNLTTEAESDTKYSISDNQGRHLTKEQQEYFKDSKVRDENGNLLTMYHGTPNGDFTVFKDGTYFTQNKEYADRYQEPGASSISTGKTKENPKTYEVYLDIKKPFDINDPKAREVYINDYIKGGNAMGINPYLTDAEYDKIKTIDWTEGEDLRDFLIEEGYDYDGLILDEGADGGYGDAVQYRGKSYVVFSPEQVKSVDNANPTNNPDIRYSLSGRDGEYMSAVERGDTETAQRLVDEAAKNAGYTTKAYHGTLTKGITEFKKSFIGSRFSYDEVGFFFTDNLKLAEDYATSEFDADRKGEVISAYIKTSNAFIFDKDYAIKNGYGNVFRDSDIIDVWDNYQSALLDEAEEMRADSIIVKDGQSMMVVAFEPNQIKSAEPITYDNNGNVIPLSERFNSRKRDIRFSLSSPVEENKNLMAIHNLHANEVLKQLDLGGMPMPSIAVTDPAKVDHEGFGDITLILDKDTIDPKKSKYNKVYSGDAYTPTFPRIEYEANEAESEAVYKTLTDATKGSPEEVRRNVLKYHPGNIDDELNRWGGEAGLIESLLDDRSMKQTYLYTKGQYVEDIFKTTETKLTEEQKLEYDTLISELGEDTVRSLKAPASESPIKYRQAWIKEHEREIRDAYKTYLGNSLRSDGHDITDGELNSIIEAETPAFFYKEVRAALNYLNNGDTTVKVEYDGEATRQEIENRIDEAEYKQWLENLFKGIERKSGLRNNVDPFTRSGNRRGFDALHDPVTLDNIVKAMRGDEQQKGQGFLGGNLSGAAAQEYGSIEDIKKDSGRIGKLTEEEHKQNNKYIEDTLNEIAMRYADGKDWWDARNALVEAVAMRETKKGIKGYLKEYDYVYKLDDSIVDDLVNLRDYIRSLPVPYFEAKPQRAVGFDEVGVFVIPNNADAALKQKLLESGYSIAEYNPDIEGDRQRVVNEFEKYKFSLSKPGENIPTDGYSVYGRDVKLQEEMAPIREDIQDLKNTLSDLRENVATLAPEPEGYKALTEEDLPYIEQEREESFRNITEDSAPVEQEYYNMPDTAPLDDKSLKLLSKNMRQELGLKNNQVAELRKIIQDFSTSETASKEDLYNAIESEFGTIYDKKKLDTLQEIKASLRSMKINVSDTIKSDIPDYFQFKQRNFGKIRFANDGLAVDDVYEGLKDIYPEYFPDNIANPTDQLLKIADVVNMDANYIEEYALPEEQIQDVTDYIYESISDYKRQKRQEASENAAKAPIDESMIPYEVPELVDDIAPVREDLSESDGLKNKIKVVEDNLGKEKKRLDDEYAKTLNPLKEEIKSKEEFISNKALNLYNELKGLKKGVRASDELSYLLDYGFSWNELKTSLLRVKAFPTSEVYSDSAVESIIRETLGREYEEKLYQVSEIEAEYKDAVEKVQKDTFETIRKLKEGKEVSSEADEAPLITKTRKDIRKTLLEDNKDVIMSALENAKNLSSPLMNNTDTIRLSEMVFGRKAGSKINEIIFQKAIDNEAKSVSWQNKERAGIKALGIKPRSKESAAVQKWGEGEYVNEFGDVVEYTDSDLMLEFPNVADQKMIKDAAIAMRAKYDEYIELANGVLTGLGFKPIEKRKNYFMHFQELGDFLSKNGIPFNPQSMKENNLPTDINGLTEFFVPQKKWFASMNQRKGKRTVYDAVTGIDKYISGVADIIYHTEDIQRGRAFEELIRDTYGQGEVAIANRSLLPEELQMERLKKQQDKHLSKYVRWLHNWTDNLAGKKNRIDRVIEDFGDRAGFSTLDTARRQVSANMIGFNLSSSLTNLIASVQAIAKTNKVAVAKGTADTIRNIVQKDDFISKNSFLTNRFGTDMLSKTTWQKIQDAGFVFMKGTDWFTANQIVRSKYYELRSKGMSEEQAHAESGKFAARIMGDRTKGANAQFYNSKLFNVIGQFQLEVNNQLYSMFYDTYHESKEKAKGDSIKTAAGITFTLGQLFAMTHVFGQTFEAVAGYNPTFDVIGIIATALGLGDDDDDNIVDNLQEAADQLLDALPYSNLITGGGRIPLSSALPDIGGLITGKKDNYGNDLQFSKEMAKLPYLLMPAGYGQIKKTTQGLKMFDKDNPVPGSYTDSGNLRFPVEDTAINRIQAGIFGQWSNKNARDYFDNERQPLREKQIQEYKDLDLPIADYWEYREGLKDQKTVEDKFNYIADLDLPIDKKNIMINNAVDRDESIDLTNYDDFSSYEEFDYAIKNPEKYCLSRAVTKEFSTYKTYVSDLNDLRADKDSNGKTISGSRKEKVINYINGLNADYGEKIILFKSEYPADDTYNYEIIDYLNNRQDISYAEMETILKELGFQVDSNGNVRW